MEAVLAEDHYASLGVDPEATLAEINAAYARKLNAFRRRMREQDRPPIEELDAVRRAFTTLSDSDARRAYDAERREESTAAAEPPPPLPSVPPVAAMAVDDQMTIMVIHDPVPAPKPAVEARLKFVGSGGEYFRIWIVNLLLSIVTLGIYSAWAKVRREQYFHRNLILDGSGFDYHGQPKSILKGRMVVFGIFMLLSLAQKGGPMPYALALLVLLPAVPWLLVKAFRFRALNTSYRGLRFSFSGDYRQAFKVLVGYGLLNMITLGIAFPLFYRQLRKFVLDNLSFGGARFSCAVGVREIYRIFLVPVLFLLLLVLGGVALLNYPFGKAGGAVMFGIIALGMAFAFLFMQVVILPYIAVRGANAVWSATTLDRHRLCCDMPVGAYLRLAIGNWLLILLTLGFFMPWAKVRMARFRAEHLAMMVDGGLDDFVAGEIKAASALGDEAAEMMDLDIGL